MKYPEFAKRFQRLCKEADLPKTQNALGKTLGVSGPYIWKVRNGESLPGMGTAMRWAKILGCSVEYLLTGKETEPSGLPPGWDHIAQALEKESPEDLVAAQRMLERYLGIHDPKS